jgi:F0F1-type ATP synthase epsilon subunit
VAAAVTAVAAAVTAAATAVAVAAVQGDEGQMGLLEDHISGVLWLHNGYAKSTSQTVDTPQPDTSSPPG